MHLCVFEVPEGGLVKFRLNSPQSESDRGEFLSEFRQGVGFAFLRNLCFCLLQVLSQVAAARAAAAANPKPTPAQAQQPEPALAFAMATVSTLATTHRR